MKKTKKRFLYLMVFTFSSLLYVNISYALDKATTVTSNFSITNRVIESANISSVADGFSYIDDGIGFYHMTDNFKDATITDIRKATGANQQWGFRRNKSLFKVKMTGQRLGHSFYVLGKYAKSSVTLSVSGNVGVSGGFNEYAKSGCTLVEPSIIVVNGTFSVPYSIEVGRAMIENCFNARSFEVSYDPGGIISSKGINREVYLDIGGLQKNADYRKAPPDIYQGSDSFVADLIHSRVGDDIRMFYNSKITIQKNPYFEGVTLPAGDNVFDVKKVKNQLKGNLTIPYVINGQFTPFNQIKLTVTSTNGFKLKDTSNNEIPYSLSTTIGVRKLNIADNGITVNPQSVITFTDLSKEFYALQGRFDADFSANSSIQTGDYTDTVTAVYTISL